MNKRLALIGLLIAIACAWSACQNDETNVGEGVLEDHDRIIVLCDTFKITSEVDSCEAIISQADSFLLGEVETDYGLLRASILTQLACPEGYSYPPDFTVDSVDSICLFMYYSSWIGDANSPMAINAYMMDNETFKYSQTYATDLNIADYCSRDSSILTNHRIVLASEKLDSVRNNDGKYIPMIRMKVNDDFAEYFASIQSFTTQEEFNKKFKGLLLETSFGSSTMLNISDIALGVYYRFGYKKAGKDTVVHDMKAFYANSEVRTVNHLYYQDKQEWVEKLQKDSNTYNYIIAPAGVYTRLRFPIKRIAELIEANTILKRPYVNKAAVRVRVENKSANTKPTNREEWLAPANHMLLIREESMDRFFAFRELPSDTCALLGQLTQGVDSAGNTIYYYNYDMSDFLTNELRQGTELGDSILNMVLVPVSVESSAVSSTASSVTSVRQQQTMSATKIRSAKNGMQLELVYSGF